MTKNIRMKKRVCFGLDFTQYLQELQKKKSIAEKEIPVEFIQKVFSPDFCKELDSKMDSNSENS